MSETSVARGRETDHDGIIRARGLILTDREGRERLRLSLDPERSDAPNIILLDSQGRARVQLRVNADHDGAPWLGLNYADGRTMIYVGQAARSSDSPEQAGAGLIGFDFDEVTRLPDYGVVHTLRRSEIAAMEARETAAETAARLAPPPARLEDGVIATLTDLARAGNEQEFRWLAQSQGVPAGELDALWAGTVKRARRRRTRRTPAVA